MFGKYSLNTMSCEKYIYWCLLGVIKLAQCTYYLLKCPYEIYSCHVVGNHDFMVGRE